MARTQINGGVGTTGVVPRGWSRDSRTIVAYSATVLYDFFLASFNSVMYCRSDDAGATWGTPVSLTTAAAPISLSIWYERWTNAAFDPIVHVLAHSDTFGARGPQYARVNLATEVVSGYQLLTDWGFGAPAGSHTSITMSAAGHLHGYIVGSVFGGGRQHWYSADGGATWDQTRSSAITPAVPTSQPDMLSMWPDLSSADPEDILMVHIASQTGNTYIHQYDQSADTWTNTTVTTAYAVGNYTQSNPISFAWERATGKIWMFMVEGSDASPASCLVKEIFGALVTNRTNLATELTYLRCSGAGKMSNGTLVGLFSYDPANTGITHNGVYYALSTDDGVTWSTPVLYSQFTTDEISNILTDPESYVAVFPIVYHNNIADAQTDYIESPLPTIEVPEVEVTQYRLMLAVAADPDIPTLNITAHNEAQDRQVLVKYERGRQRAVLGEPPAAAAMTAVLLNEDMGRYDLDEPTPGLAMRLNKMVGGTWHHMCQVNLDEPVHTLDRFRAIVQTSGFGTLAKLANKRASTALFKNITTGEAIGRLLDAVGFPAFKRDLDAGEVTLRYWWMNDEDAMTALNKILNSEGITCEFYEDAIGDLRFMQRSARFTETRATTAQSTLTSQGATPQLSDFQYFTGGREVTNYASHERIARHDDDTPDQIVWQDDNGNGDYIIGPSASLVLLAVTTQPFFDAVVPVLNTDYEIGIGSVTVTLERTSGQRTKITFTAGASGVTIGPVGANTGITLRATPTIVGATFVESSRVDATTSIAAYGLRPWTGEMSKELEWWDTRDNLDAIVAWKKDPHGRVRIKVLAHSSEAANLAVAMREIGDRVRITNQNHDFDGYGWIMRIEHEVIAPASLAEPSGAFTVGAEYSIYECLVISVEAGSVGNGVGGTNPYDSIDNEGFVLDTTGLDDQGLLLRWASDD